MSGLIGSINYKEINFDTIDRVSGTIQAPQFVITSSAKIKQIQLVGAEIPFTWYVFTSANNKIDFIEPASGSAVTAVLPPGNYTTDEIIAQIGILMTTISPNGYTYSVSVNNNSNRITITSTGNFNLLWGTGLFNNQSMANELGFNSVDNVGTNNYTSNFTYNLSGDNYVYIKCDQVLGFDNSITNSNTSTDSKIIAKIPVTVNSGGTIKYTAIIPLTTQLLFNDSVNLTQLNFSLTKRNNVPLDTNNRNWSFTLGIFT
jgi:hypothetical protein